MVSKRGKHRLDGPAMEFADGTKQWYQNDLLHRLDGPAIERPNGYKAWWVNGEEYTEEEYWQHPDVIAHKANTTKPKEASPLREIMMKTICDKIADLSDEDFFKLFQEIS